MADMEYPLSSKWSNDDKISRQELNRMLADTTYLGKVKKLSVDNDGEGVIQAVTLGAFLERYSFNCRIELLGTTAIRVPFTADRPQTININGFMLQATGNVDSSVYAGAANTIFILAIRTDGSTTFTIANRTSANEGTDERLIGQAYWNGAAFEAGTIVNYETAGYGIPLTHDVVTKAWVQFNSAGTIQDSYNVASVAKPATGIYDIAWDNDFSSSAYVVVATPEYATRGMIASLDSTTVPKTGAGCRVFTANYAGAAGNSACSVIAIGDLN